MASSEAQAQAHAQDPDFPCSLTIHIPFPDSRLAQIALRALSVDKELSPLVRRSFSLTSRAVVSAVPDALTQNQTQSDPETQPGALVRGSGAEDEDKLMLETRYKATTNRMLRVAVNGFFESLGVVLGAMRELDVDVVGEEWVGDFPAASSSSPPPPPSSSSILADSDGVDRQKEEVELRRLNKVQGIEERGVVG